MLWLQHRQSVAGKPKKRDGAGIAAAAGDEGGGGGGGRNAQVVVNGAVRGLRTWMAKRLRSKLLRWP